MNFKDKKVPVTELVFGLNLEFTLEDKEQIVKLIECYFRKKTTKTCPIYPTPRKRSDSAITPCSNICAQCRTTHWRIYS